ncbi:uncharacterized protein LOC127266459 [Andrographis paniculata]|uniref:uncharacterized protein LOC127266459 n=1 Tax=Andrographis paniculata TaxID=175694 RepID=UPI0021E71EDC|nr:uncharacterized protein LOC127266459 [Andrographis paniculata]
MDWVVFGAFNVGTVLIDTGHQFYFMRVDLVAINRLWVVGVVTVTRRAVAISYVNVPKRSKNSSQSDCLLDVGDEKFWEEARCPICMEHPHNAIILRCSSRDKGCRPFMCDTSYRHSNCLDQFCKSAAASSVPNLHIEQQAKLLCPLCRGVVTGLDVVQPARRFMNSKTRSCSLETCNFSGDYDELRKHARQEHPFARSSEVSPTRKSNWERLEQEWETQDVLVHQSGVDYDMNAWENFWGGVLDFTSGISDSEDDLADEMYASLPFPLV